MVFALGIISIAIVVLSYALTLLHPASGRGAGAKMATLGLCLAGYAIPILNLFPWIWLYIFVVMRYPK